MIAAAHQSCFLPWLGYLHKMSRCDVFIVLDDVQFTRGNYINRVQLKTVAGPRWLTLPVARSFGQTIREARLADDVAPGPLVRAIQHAYARAPYHATLGPALEQLLGDVVRPSASLFDANEALRAWLCRQLGVECRVVRQSSLPWSGARNEMLVSLCRAVGADTYLCGRVAAAEYLDDGLFEREGIRVELQSFSHPVHPQLFGDFQAGLSAIDLLFNCGDAGRQLLAAA